MMQGQAAVLKREIEARLANRIPAALSPIARQAPRLHPIGNSQIDSLLGGLPLGSVCELFGPEGSGRSSLALSLLAGASGEGACAYIDASDRLSPRSAAAAGIELANLLWVRFAPASPTKRSLQRQDFQPSEADSRTHRPAHDGCGSPHPRKEAKGQGPALEQRLVYTDECTGDYRDKRRKRKTEGTPGHPNRPLGLHTASQEQVDWERWNLRQADEADPLRRMDRQAAEAARERARAGAVPALATPHEGKPWDRLGRALRATDQVLQSGGFRVVVLDLASVEPKKALRIPSATWFRFHRAAQESDAVLLLLTREPCARSSAACVLECSAAEPPKVQGVLVSAPHIAELARQRSGPAVARKAPGWATGWEAAPAWMRAVGS